MPTIVEPASRSNHREPGTIFDLGREVRAVTCWGDPQLKNYVTTKTERDTLAQLVRQAFQPDICGESAWKG